MDVQNQKPKILIVDDNEFCLEIYEEVLLEFYELVRATTGEQALDILDTVCPKIIILDVNMPGIDGYETCQMIKNTPGFDNTKILMVTAKALKGDMEKGLAAGADDYITKPFRTDQLLDKVNHFAMAMLNEQRMNK